MRAKAIAAVGRPRTAARALTPNRSTDFAEKECGRNRVEYSVAGTCGKVTKIDTILTGHTWPTL